MRPRNLLLSVVLLSLNAVIVYAQSGLELNAPGDDLYLERLPPADSTSPPLDDTLPVDNAPLWTPAIEDGSVWTSPSQWYSPEIWDTSFELGINGATGNSETFSIKTGANVKRETEYRVYEIDATYARTAADGTTTQDIFNFDAKADFKFGDSPLSLFFTDNLVHDRLREFDWRIVINSGLGYRFIDTDTTTAKARFGAGVSREIGGVDDEWKPESVFGMDYERQLTKKQKLAATVDYFPEWEDFSNYRLKSKFGWELLLDKDPDLSLKIEVIDRYDSTPNGNKPNDINYSILLLWKL